MGAPLNYLTATRDFFVCFYDEETLTFKLNQTVILQKHHHRAYCFDKWNHQARSFFLFITVPIFTLSYIKRKIRSARRLYKTLGTRSKHVQIDLRPDLQ